MLLTILDVFRILLTGVAFFIGYQIGFSHGYNPAAQLHFMTPVLIVAIAGISGIEGLFLGKKSAEAKGYASDGNYQRQSAFAMISLAVVVVLVWFVNWGIKAELTILLTFLLFFSLSSVNHAIQAIRHKNYKWQNINRPVITLLLIAGLLYPLLKALE
jgi:hypothetical protein